MFIILFPGFLPVIDITEKELLLCLCISNFYNQQSKFF